MFDIRVIDEEIRKKVVDFITVNWGSPIMVTKSKDLELVQPSLIR